MRPIPRGLIALLIVAGILHVTMLGLIVTSAERDVILVCFGALWLVLLILDTLANVMIAPPRWSLLPVILLNPLSGMATVLSIDQLARGSILALAIPIVSPLLIMLHSAWPWLTRWHDVIAPRHMAFIVWGLTFFFAIIAVSATA